MVFGQLNGACELILLTMEKQGNGVAISQPCHFISRRRLETRWYRKQYKKNIIIHRLSSHPAVVKANVSRAMEVAAVRTSSSEDKRRLSVQQVEAKARENGYHVFRFRTILRANT